MSLLSQQISKAIKKCVDTQGTEQGCDSGTHGIPSSGRPRYWMNLRSETVKNAVRIVEMDARGHDGKRLSMTMRLSSEKGREWETSGTAVEVCEQYRADQAVHRSPEEQKKFEESACWIKEHGVSLYSILTAQVMACIKTRGSPIGCNAGAFGIAYPDDDAATSQYYWSGSIVDGVLYVEHNLWGNDGKHLVSEARPEKTRDGTWTWVVSGTAPDACKR